MWSTHSRRIDPISRWTKPFCQGEAGAIGWSRMPMARSRRVTTSARRVCLLTTAVEANCLVRSNRLPRGFALQSKHAPVRTADPFIMIAHVIGSSCADNV
jgi:hypothetical protein